MKLSKAFSNVVMVSSRDECPESHRICNGKNDKCCYALTQIENLRVNLLTRIYFPERKVSKDEREHKA